MTDTTWKTQMLVHEPIGHKVETDECLVGTALRAGKSFNVSFGPPDYSGTISVNEVVGDRLTPRGIWVLSGYELSELKSQGKLVVKAFNGRDVMFELSK